MRILIWHLHGSWMTSFVQGPHDYLVPVTPDRGPFGLWPGPDLGLAGQRRRGHAGAAARRAGRRRRPAAPRRAGAGGWPGWAGYRDGTCQRCTSSTTRRRAGRGHTAPDGRHPGIMIVHVTQFNALYWDCGRLSVSR